MNKKLYVGNLLYEITDEDLKTLFTQVGTVVSATVIRYQDTGRSKGFGFVEMSTEEEAQKAIETFNEQDNKGRKLVVAARQNKSSSSAKSVGSKTINRNIAQILDFVFELYTEKADFPLEELYVP